MKNFKYLVAPFLLTSLALGAKGQTTERFPFVLPWNDNSEAGVNLTSWLNAPAGKSGFIASRDGHFFNGQKRVRLFGVNFVGEACFPPREEADFIAGRVGKFGMNCVRLQGFLKDPSTRLDQGQFERLDYFVHALKQRGIYVAISLGTSVSSGLDQVDPAAIQQQKELIKHVLTHVNPNTKTSYGKEPAVAFVSLNEKSSLLQSWYASDLDDTPSLPALQKRWNDWLKAKYKTPEALQAAWAEGASEVGTEVLGDQSKGPASWTLARVGITHVTMEKAAAPDGSAAPPEKPTTVVQIKEIGSAPWQAAFVRYKVKLTGGKVYILEFDAKTTNPGTIGAAFHNVTQLLLSDVKFKVTDSWKHYRLALRPAFSAGDARIGFVDLGAAKGEYYFGNMTMHVDGISGLQPGESLGQVNPVSRGSFYGRTNAVQNDWLMFLLGVESRYWSELGNYARKELGTGSMLAGANAAISPFGTQSSLDLVCARGIWSDANILNKTWDNEAWTIGLKSMVDDRVGGLISSIGKYRVAGKPFACVEFNGAAPNPFSQEALILLSAYASLQDWDALFAFNYTSSLESMKKEMFGNFYELAQHPTKMAVLPASAALFSRGDVASVPPRLHVITPQQYVDAIRNSGWPVDALKLGVLPEEFLRHGVQIGFAGTTQPPPPPVQSALPGVTSDSMDLRWTQFLPKNYATIDTAKSAGVIGFNKEQAFRFMHVDITPASPEWSAITLTTLDGADLATAKRILVTATASAANTGMTWKGKNNNSLGESWGSKPTLIEGVTAQITLRGKAAKAWALDEKGQRRAEVPVTVAAGKTELKISPEWKTLWYELAVE